MKKSLSVLTVIAMALMVVGFISPSRANGVPPEPMTVSTQG